MQMKKKSMMAVQWLAGDGAVVAAGRHLLDDVPWSLSSDVVGVGADRDASKGDFFFGTRSPSFILTKIFGQKVAAGDDTFDRDEDANQKAR